MRSEWDSVWKLSRDLFCVHLKKEPYVGFIERVDPNETVSI